MRVQRLLCRGKCTGTHSTVRRAGAGRCDLAGRHALRALPDCWKQAVCRQLCNSSLRKHSSNYKDSLETVNMQAGCAWPACGGGCWRAGDGHNRRLPAHSPLKGPPSNTTQAPVHATGLMTGLIFLLGGVITALRMQPLQQPCAVCLLYMRGLTATTVPAYSNG